LIILIIDIDDTIKISQVLDRLKLLYHTFIEEHGQPVAGMPQLYHSLVTRLSNPTFFYLSASPWQLYLFLLDFVRTNYPFGQIILRDMSYLELSSFVSTLTIGTQEYKEDRMEKIHRWLPHKQFFCIGDSSQKDPEAYGTTYIVFQR
jgi:phosphatidate phosphatase APP1